MKPRKEEPPGKETGLECPRCHKKTGVESPCPYQMEINDATEEEAMCNCCPSCRQECQDDI